MVIHSIIADMQLLLLTSIYLYICTTGEQINALFWLFLGFTLTFGHCHSENELAMPQHIRNKVPTLCTTNLKVFACVFVREMKLCIPVNRSMWLQQPF